MKKWRIETCEDGYFAIYDNEACWDKYSRRTDNGHWFTVNYITPGIDPDDRYHNNRLDLIELGDNLEVAVIDTDDFEIYQEDGDDCAIMLSWDDDEIRLCADETFDDNPSKLTVQVIEHTETDGYEEQEVVQEFELRAI